MSLNGEFLFLLIRFGLLLEAKVYSLSVLCGHHWSGVTQGQADGTVFLTIAGSLKEPVALRNDLSLAIADPWPPHFLSTVWDYKWWRALYVYFVN